MSHCWPEMTELILHTPSAQHLSPGRAETGMSTEATLKKKIVSCPAGGHYCGYSGGRNSFLLYIFFSLYRNDVENAGEKKRKISKM